MEGFVDMNHELVQLLKAIDWSEVESESESSGYYCSNNGRSGVRVRKKVGPNVAEEYLRPERLAYESWI